MDRKEKVYASMMHEINERELKLKGAKSRPKTKAQIERIVYSYRDLQLSMLEEYNLTEQERAVAFYLLFGLSYLHITKLMLLERSTIGYHVHNIFKKCHVKSRQDLCMLVLTKMYFAGSDEEKTK